ncbi:thiosulfate/3-mercaptopyruvate sulfurtransferase [Neobacillus niacini]|uniref:sulfurtransferase n=1 Tax=Neobacillus niacini TaxID=86668 RepID=UPI00277D4B1A|nr:sulfurtransferase [Neobacillus niacini]MDQ1001832.1 thiosulfate/3-mercaptopyruvate sulfurtransferase [Neobacillus niacini]
MNLIINKEWLLKNLNEQNVRIVDCTFSLADPKKGRQEYENNHIPGACYFDLEVDLSGEVAEHGGRHPLPNIEEFTLKLEQAGIDNSTTVISYDQGEGAFAARFWWLLQYLGHEKVFVLDGGFKGWVEGNLPITSEIPSFKKTTFKPDINHDLLTSMEEVKAVADEQNSNIVLIDSREERRYLGLEEPIDKKAGRIPGAINKPWFEGLNAGYFKPAEIQKQRFSDINPDNEIIVYCGSGVTAAPNFLALKAAGFEKVKLYLGSFSDWISYQENKIE